MSGRQRQTALLLIFLAMSTHNAFLGRAIVLVAMAGLSACATVDAKSDYDRATDFSKYSTYQLLSGKLMSDSAATGGTPVPENTMVKERITQAINEQLSAKGLRKVASGGDLLVGYVGGARNRQELETMAAYDPMLDPYWGGWWGPPDTYVYDYERGTLVIDLIDASNKKLVWRSVVEADRDKVSELGDPKLIQQAVSKAFAKFPPEPGK